MSIRAGVVVVLFLATILSSADAATETQVSQTVISPEPFLTRTVAATSGNGYLVAWGSAAPGRNEDLLNDPPMTIYIRAVGADGIPLQAFATAVGKGESPSIAWNGHEYLVVWGITTPTTGALPTPSLMGIRVREDGTLVDPAPVTLISEVNPYSYLASVAWSGTQYIVTWARGAALVDTDLHVKQIFLPVGIPLYSASSGGDFIVVVGIFSAASGANKQSLVIIPVSSKGDVSTPIPLAGPFIRIANVNGGYLVLGGDLTGPLLATRLRADGTIISASPFYLQPEHFPSVTAWDGRVMAAWVTGQSSLCTARIDTASPPVCSNPQTRPTGAAIAMASGSILFAWRDAATDGDVLRASVSSPGAVPPVENSVGRIISDHLPAPAAVRRADGTVTAAWTEYNPTKKQSEVRIGGISSKGVRLADRVVFATPLDQGAPIVSAGAGRTAILWTEGAEPKIRMTIIDDASGTLIATLPLASGVTPSAAFNGKEWLVTWQSDDVIRFAILNSDGFVLSSGAAPATTAPPSQSAPAAAWSGKTFVLAWIETNRVQISTINAAGAPSAPVTLDSRDIFPGTLSIAGNGSRVLVAWGRTGNILRQAVFDADGRQIGKFIDFAWPDALTRTTTHAMPSGFATLAGAHVALTSADAVGLDTLDVPPAATAGDFVIDPANRFTFIYPRLIGRGSSANFAQTMGLPRRRPQNR